jgi:hypothetical protein
MLRLPSAQKTYDDFYSGDPALVQLGADASKAQHEERVRKLAIARKTGDWSEFRIEGQLPTKFGMRLIGSEPLRKLRDLHEKDGLTNVWAALCFRCALVDVTNLGDFSVRRSIVDRYPELGAIATEDVCTVLDGIDPDIVNELGVAAFVRSSQRDPS